METLDDRRQAGLKVAAEMLGDGTSTPLAGAASSRAFGAFRGDMALRNVFGEVWTRPGLDRRGRSLVTLGILIGRGQVRELRIHVMAAIRNGCTVEEIEEAIYQSCCYAGFPAANEAAIAAAEVLRANGLIE